MNPSANTNQGSNTQLCSHWRNFNILEGFLYFPVEGWWVQQRHFSLPSLPVLLGACRWDCAHMWSLHWRWHFSLVTEADMEKDLLPIKPLFLLMQLEVWCVLQELSEERIPHGHVCLNTACGYSFLQTAVQKSKCHRRQKDNSLSSQEQSWTEELFSTFFNSWNIYFWVRLYYAGKNITCQHFYYKPLFLRFFRRALEVHFEQI